MSNPPNNKGKQLFFAAIVLLCLVIALGYVFLSARRAQNGTTQVVAPVSENSSEKSATTSPLTVPIPAEKNMIDSLPDEPFLVSRNLRDGEDIGKVWVSTLAASDQVAWMSDLHCERVYFAAQTGICLQRIVQTVSAYTEAVLFDRQFRPTFRFKTDGIPSRARVSPDGRYAAFTVFVFGHSYADEQFSTATFILDTTTGLPLANLEEFTVFQDGEEIDYPDFNYWGVTFSQQSNTFYATLRFNQTAYLVKGDIAKRTVTILYTGVECPSLSPDETRVAFKKLVSRANWHLAVLDLTTFTETEVVVTDNVDDQAEWLDNQTLLYGAINVNSPPTMHIMRVRADGKGSPARFVFGANSPAVIRLP